MFFNNKFLIGFFIFLFNINYAHAQSKSQFLVPIEVAPGKWGYKDSLTGKIIIYWHFRYAGRFGSNGLAKVAVKDQFGYIDSHGILRIPYSNAVYGPFENDRAFNIKNRDGYLVVKDNMYAVHKISDFKDAELNWKLMQNKVRYILFSYPADSIRVNSYLNAEKSLINPDIHFPDLEPFMVSSVSQKWGYRNKKTKEVIIFWEFDEARPFGSNGIARVKIGKKYGYIDQSGVLVIPFSTALYGDFNSDTAYKFIDSFGWIEFKNHQYRKHYADGKFSDWNIVKSEQRFRAFTYPADSAFVANLIARQINLDLESYVPAKYSPPKQNPRIVFNASFTNPVKYDTFESRIYGFGIEGQFPVARNVFLIGGFSTYQQDIVSTVTSYNRSPKTAELGVMFLHAPEKKTGVYARVCLLPVFHNRWEHKFRQSGKVIEMQGPGYGLTSGLLLDVGVSLTNRVDLGLGYLYLPTNYTLPQSIQSNLRFTIGINIY